MKPKINMTLLARRAMNCPTESRNQEIKESRNQRYECYIAFPKSTPNPRNQRYECLMAFPGNSVGMNVIKTFTQINTESAESTV